MNSVGYQHVRRICKELRRLYASAGVTVRLIAFLTPPSLDLVTPSSTFDLGFAK